MQILPDWIPNVHPLIVHFSIAFLFIAFLLIYGQLFSINRFGSNYDVGIQKIKNAEHDE